MNDLRENPPTTPAGAERFATPPIREEDAGTRLDVWLQANRPDHSRAQWQELIKAGRVLVNGQARKPNYTIKQGDTIECDIPPPRPIELLPEDIPLHILFEDADILVLNKPAGLVVHPAPGHDTGTLVNALLHHCRDLAGIGGEYRPGLVHRLDKDTTGVLVIAKSEPAMMNLAAQFKGRRVQKEYVALVWGHPRPPAGSIRTLVGRHPHDRKKMTAKAMAGRPAITHYETIRQFKEAAVVRVTIETGRTHQIRVHMAHIGHPIVGDQQYGKPRKHQLPVEVNRQMLHAQRLAFTHPKTGAALEFTAPPPEDMRALLVKLGEASAG